MISEGRMGRMRPMKMMQGSNMREEVSIVAFNRDGLAAPTDGVKREWANKGKLTSISL